MLLHPKNPVLIYTVLQFIWWILLQLKVLDKCITLRLTNTFGIFYIRMCLWNLTASDHELDDQRLLGQLHFADPVIKVQAIQLFCSDAYGVSTK